MSNSKETLANYAYTLKHLTEFALGQTSTQEFVGNSPFIIGVHGTIGKWPSSTLPIYLKERGLSGKLLDFGLQTSRIESYLEKLSQEVSLIRVKKIIVGFSTGGLMAVRYAQLYGWKNVDRIITIASPFNGIKKNVFSSLFPVSRDIKPGSQFLKDLFENPAPQGKLICLFPREDEFLPKNTFGIPGAINYTFPGIWGHATMGSSKEVKYLLDNLIL